MLLPHDNAAYNRRITKAASALVIRLPFFGYLLFGSGIRVIGTAQCKTMATNGILIKCGIQFVLLEDLDIVMFGLLHETLHVYLVHHGRRGNRDPMVWNTAADIYVNMLCSKLLGDGINNWPVPQRFIQPQPWAANMTVEQIYDAIFEQMKKDPKTLEQYCKGDDEINNGTDMSPEPEPEDNGTEDPEGDPQENTEWQETFREDVSRAKALAENSPMHRELPDEIRERLDKIMRPSLPWGSLVRGDVADNLGWDEATYCPPKMKYYPIILPQTRQLKERVLLLGVDVSASVTQELINIFISNVQSAAYRATKTVIVTFDEIVRERYETKRPRDIFTRVKFKSGAHSYTSALGLFEIADEVNPSAICCLTDGYIELPDHPYKKTTFVIPTGGKQPPWGRCFVMEHPWR